MTIDWTLNVGTLVSALIVAGAIIGAYVSLRERIVRLETKVDTLYRWWQTMIERRGAGAGS
jgi:hypothetical protein